MSRNSDELDGLIGNCKHGDEHSCHQLFDRFGKDVARWLARLDYAATAEDIQDLVIQSFVKVFRCLGTYRPEDCAFRIWLYQQTESVAIDHIRKRTALKRSPPGEVVSIHTSEAGHEPAVEPADASATPDQIVVQNEKHRMLFEALDALGPPESRCRKLIGLVYFGGFTYDEVSKMLEMTVKTVSSALSKCMTELRRVAAKVFGSVVPSERV